MKKGQRHDIRMGEEMRVTYPDSVETYALSSCLGLGILNTRQRIGYLGHYFGWDESEAELLIDRALRECGDMRDLFVTLAGSFPARTYRTENYEEIFQKFKSYERGLMEMLLSKGIPETNISNKIPRGTSDHISFALRVNTRSNRMKVWDTYHDED